MIWRMQYNLVNALRRKKLCKLINFIASNLMYHITLHFLVPGLLATAYFRQRWLYAYALMMVTMLVDIDHLFASPIYDPNRCSIGFHPLHQPWWIALYFLLCYFPKTRLIGLGLVIHMALDAIDCQLMAA